MSEVKRLDMRHDDIGMNDYDDGRWVTYEDFSELQKERDALAAENAALKDLQPTREMVKAAQRELESYEVLLDDDAIVFVWQAMRGKQKAPVTEARLNAVRAEVIPEGYVLVPQQMHLSAEAMESLCFHCGDGGFAFGDFTDGILWVGDIENDDGTKTYGLNIATAEYPEEGSANICQFTAKLRATAPKGDSDAE